MKRVRVRANDSERGSVEAGLVLIPTTIFFLMILQIVTAGSWQVLERTNLHDLVIRTSIQGGDLEYARRSFESDSLANSGATNQAAEDSRQGILGGKRELRVNSEKGFFGTIRKFELSSRVPILGNLFGGAQEGILRVKNQAVSISN